MDTGIILKEKLNQLIFLEIDRGAVAKFLGTELAEVIFIPVKASNIIDRLKSSTSFDEIPLSQMIEGMLITLGCDSNFKYNKEYLKILNNNLSLTHGFARKEIYEFVSSEDYIDAYVLLKGYVEVDNTLDTYSKLLSVAEKIREKDSEFKTEEISLIERAKEFENFSDPFIYEALIFYDEEDYRKVLDCIDEFLKKGGYATEEIRRLQNNAQVALHYELGKEQVTVDPKAALKLLLPLLDEFNDNPMLYYHIGVAYRVLGNHEKSIYYLNEALAVNGEYIEVINELGLNLASVGDYNSAVTYFKKAFEVTRSIEICTNIISCYISMGNKEQAKLHLDIAKKINSSDEIVIQLEEMMKGDKFWN